MSIPWQYLRKYREQHAARFRFSILLPVFCSSFSGIVAQTPRAISSDTTITVPVTTTSDTTVLPDTAISDTPGATRIDTVFLDSSTATTINSAVDDSLMDSVSLTPPPSVTSPGTLSTEMPPSIVSHDNVSGEDSTGVADGWYFSAGIGWTIGGFELLSLWENAQPDSLSQLGITDTSFRILSDSSLRNTGSMDTALFTFSIKEAPAVYTMSFPVTLSFLSIRGNRRLALSLSGSWMRKVFTGTIAASGDTLDRKVDYKESINVYTLLLSLQWGGSIPQKYFSIDGVDRSFFTLGLDIAPVVASRIHRTATSTSDQSRFSELERALSRSRVRFFHGGAAGVRLGISMIKRLNARSATDFGVVYTIRGYGYFLENGNRVSFNAIDPSARTKDRPLFWISNRLELSFAFLRCLQR